MKNFFKKRAIKRQIKEGEAILAEVDKVARLAETPDEITEQQAGDFIALMAKGATCYNRLRQLRAEVKRL